jgi:hypothetical protein
MPLDSDFLSFLNSKEFLNFLIKFSINKFFEGKRKLLKRVLFPENESNVNWRHMEGTVVGHLTLNPNIKGLNPESQCWHHAVGQC